MFNNKYVFKKDKKCAKQLKLLLAEY